MIKAISTRGAPQAIGPYSQGVAAGDFIFVSGQLPLDPETGAMPDTIEAQTKRSLENLKAILEAAGAGLGDVVKTTVFLKDMGEFAAMNAVYAGYFPPERPPARAAVEVARLPKDVKVEIEAVAVRTQR